MSFPIRQFRAHSAAVARLVLAIALISAAAVAAVPAAAAAASATGHVVPGTLLGVAGTSTRNAWAVGTLPGGTLASGPGGTLIEHWNGTGWRVVPSPSPATGKDRSDVLEGVAAISRNDAWAVGYYTSGSSVANETTAALIVHWNGKRWSQVRCRCGSSLLGVPALSGIAAVSPSDIWAVGSGSARPLIMHWNGVRWAPQSLPGDADDELTAVSATSARNAWAVGMDLNNFTSLTAHWDGTKWQLVHNPNSGRFNPLHAVVATSERTAWAVGCASDADAMIEHWNGKQWKLVTP
jgi:hypothetical protein